MSAVDRTGDRYGRLLVVARSINAVDKRGKQRAMWECRCDCGNSVVASGKYLGMGKTRSCGCIRRESARAQGKVNATHGEARHGDRSPEWRCWSGMRARCLNPKSPDFSNYGGRGISVCDRWSEYENFLLDMGRKPTPSHSIDRIDNEGNYEPSNCRWATWHEQALNRRPRVKNVR